MLCISYPDLGRISTVGLCLSLRVFFLCLATVTKRDVSFGLCSQEQNSLYNKQE